jgi:opacity protein-like surface antigen
MSNNLKKHQWEETAWEQMELLLDDELPVTPGKPYSRWLFSVLFLFILVSGVVMLFLPEPEVHELAAGSINTEEPVAYSIAAVNVSSDQRAYRSIGWRDLSNATFLDRAWAVSVSPFASLESVNFHGNFRENIEGNILDRSDRQLSVASLRVLDIPSLQNMSFDFEKMKLNDADFPQAIGSISSSLFQYIEGNGSYLTEGHWGGSFHYGLKMKLSSQWSGSIAAGYQYHRFSGIRGENNYSVPLVLPDPGTEIFVPNTSNENNSFDLPELHPNLHQLGLTAKLAYTPWKDQGIQMGMLVRGQRNMYHINPEVVNSPMRFSYRDLNTTKQQDDWSHYSLSLGAGLSYALNPRWEIHSRAFYTNNFIGLKGKPTFIVDHLWSAECGIRMYW